MNHVPEGKEPCYPGCFYYGDSCFRSDCKYRLPPPVPKYCCDVRLKTCKKCGADVWKSAGDRDYGDWEEEVFDCQHCGNRIYVELPD